MKGKKEMHLLTIVLVVAALAVGDLVIAYVRRHG
jgi:hypothetical protein